METMSLQMMRTLSTTIEAKDEYTRGHSYLCSNDGMLFNYLKLFFRQSGWPVQNVIRNTDLTDIMQMCCIFKISDFFFIPPKFFCNQSRVK